MKTSRAEESERGRVAKAYGVDIAGMQELALLPCGASIRRVGHDDPVAGMFRLSPRAPERYPLRDGDAGLFCPKGCIGFVNCPLVKEYLGIDPGVDLECFSKRLVDNFKTGDGYGNLADVGDRDGAVPHGAAASVRIRFLLVKCGGELHFVVPPMAKIVDEGDDGRSAARDDGEAGDCV